MSSYLFRGAAKTWTPRDEDESKQQTAVRTEQLNVDGIPKHFNYDFGNDKWSVKQVIRFLRFYRAHHCLWDTRHPDNRNRKLRKAALIDITVAMGDGGTCAQVLQKINVLRATYRYEKRRIKQRMRKGIGAKTKLKWFALADSFLRDVPRPEKNKKKEYADSDSDLEEAVVFTIDTETMISGEDYDHSQYADADFKMDADEDQKSVANNSCLLNATPPPTKTEGNSSTEGDNVLIKNRKWTTHESLQFVFLLRSYPKLWHLPINDADEIAQSREQEKALEDISRTMQLPKERLLKRLQTFLNSYQFEIAKMKEDNTYTPNFVWWPMVQEYLDTPKLVPLNEAYADGQQLSHNKIALTDHLNNDVSVELALSAPVSLTVSHICSPTRPNNEDSNSISSCSFSEHPNFSNPPMKLVWNGLEDNLLEGKWSLKHSVKFLRLYGAHSCLWDLNDADYRSREMRTAAIEDIAAVMGFGLDADYVAKKIKIFRITYMQHRKRMLEAIKLNREPNIQLRWFPLADSFLRPHIGLRSIKKQEREMPQFDFQYVYANLNLIDPGLLADLK